MDRSELLNDAEQALRLALDDRESSMWTAMPGIVQSVDFEAMTCAVQLAIQGTIQNEDRTTTAVNYPPLEDLPIVFPSAGGFSITFPIAKGDEVLVVFGARCIDSWWQSGGTQNRPMEARMHDLSDGFAIPGPRSQPKTIDSISTTDFQIRNEDGTVFISIKPNGKFRMVNASTDLKTVLTDLQSALNTFMTTLAAFSGGGTPVTQAMIQAPAATAETALTNVLTEIGELLA
jgi:hypothetical protein